MNDLGLSAIDPLIRFSLQTEPLVAPTATTTSSSIELANKMAAAEAELEASFTSTLKTFPHATLPQLLHHVPLLSDFVLQAAKRIFLRAQATASLWYSRAHRSKTPPPSEAPTAPPKPQKLCDWFCKKEARPGCWPTHAGMVPADKKCPMCGDRHPLLGPHGPLDGFCFTPPPPLSPHMQSFLPRCMDERDGTYRTPLDTDSSGSSSSSADDDMPALEAVTLEEIQQCEEAKVRIERLAKHYEVMAERGMPGLLETYTRCSHGPIYMLWDGSLYAACGRC